MCGIIGSVNLPISRDHLSLIHHRGPDACDMYIHQIDDSSSVFLGHTRLSILDLTEAGAQPMISDCKNYIIVFNGEIYNHLELRSKLHGIEFKGHSDTETILYYIREYGIQSIKDFNGIFSLGYLDLQKSLIYIARDRFGVKPLYYSVLNNRFIFSSELKVILKCGVEKDISLESLDHFLSLRYNPSPETLYKHINKLEPATILMYRIIDNKYIKEKFLFKVPQENITISEDDALDEYDHLLSQAVRRQMLSDVPIGLFLSGGIDSALLGSLMIKHASYKINTYTIGFDGAGDFNELDDARFSSKILGTNHHEECITKNDYFDLLNRSYYHTEEPISEPTIPALFHVSAMAARDVKVVLSGQGADEPMAGYNRYKGEYYLKKYSLFLKYLSKLIPNHYFSKYENIDQLIHVLGFSDEFDRFIRLYDIFKSNEKDLLYKDELISSNRYGHKYLFFDHYQKSRGLKDSLNRLLYLDIRTMLPDNLLLFNDKITMANSIENRVPFLDNDLVDFIEKLPSEYKLKNGVSKYLLRKVAQRYLPENIIHRKKRGFKTPFALWLKDPSNSQFIDLVRSSDSMSSMYFDKKYIEDMLSNYRSGQSNYFKHLYTIFSLEMWYLNFYNKY